MFSSQEVVLGVLEVALSCYEVTGKTCQDLLTESRRKVVTKHNREGQVQVSGAGGQEAGRLAHTTRAHTLTHGTHTHTHAHTRTHTHTTCTTGTPPTHAPSQPHSGLHPHPMSIPAPSLRA